MTIAQGFRIESAIALISDWLPAAAFTQAYTRIGAAIAAAIEGVDDPSEQEVRVVNVATGEIVWRSTEEDFE